MRTLGQIVALVLGCSIAFVTYGGCATGPTQSADFRRPQLAGFVRDTSGAPLAGVQVTAAGRTAMTDADGQWEIELSRTGAMTVTFTRNGYETLQREVNVRSGVNRIDVTLTTAR